MEIKQNQRQALLEDFQTGFGKAGFPPQEANALSEKVVNLLRPLSMEIREIPEALFDVKGTIQALATVQKRSPASIKEEVERDPSALLRHHRLVKIEHKADDTAQADATTATGITKSKAPKTPKPNGKIPAWPDASTIFYRAAQHVLETGNLPSLIGGKTPGQLSRAFRKGEITGYEPFCQERPKTLPDFYKACGLTQNNGHGFPVPVKRAEIEDIMHEHDFLQHKSPPPRPRS